MARNAAGMAIRIYRCCGFVRDEIGLTGTKFGCGQALLRRMHRDRRQAGGARLHHLGFRCCRPRGHDHRRSASHRRSSGPEGLASGQRSAMRLLPGRADHAGRGAARPRTRNPVTIRSAKRWRATSAAAAATSGSKTRSISHRRGFDHEHHHTSRSLRGIRRSHPGRKNFAPRRPQGSRHRRRAACSPRP